MDVNRWDKIDKKLWLKITLFLYLFPEFGKLFAEIAIQWKVKRKSCFAPGKIVV